MKTSLFVGLLVLTLSSFTAEEFDSVLLTGGSRKIWVLTSISPEIGSGSCNSASNRSADNVYIFSSGGKFEFTNGSVTEEKGCKTNCCSDLVNFIGTWTVADNNLITIIANYETENSSNVLNTTLFSGRILSLEENSLKFTVKDDDKVLRTFEFKAKL